MEEAQPQACADTPAVSVVGKIKIPAEVKRHRFYREALIAVESVIDADNFKDRVVGTSNGNKEVQLYGWAPNIAAHSDNTGFVYGVCLNAGVTHLYATDERTPVPGPTYEAVIGVGDVFRLNDRYSHWTRDDGPRIAAFVGPFTGPADAEAIQRLSVAIGRLAGGTYGGAPRVAVGFMFIQPDECWVTSDFESRALMLVSEANAADAWIIQCSTCAAPATKVDHFWPYESSRNRCAKCLNAEAS